MKKNTKSKQVAKAPSKLQRKSKRVQRPKTPIRSLSSSSLIQRVTDIPTKQNPHNDPAYIKESLGGYAVIPPSEYEHISPGDHIRYIGIDGNFRTGGYVWFKKVSEDGSPYWMIGQSKNPPRNFSDVMHFILYWHKIKKLWKKLAVEADLLRKSIDLKQHYINDISTFLLEKYGDEFREFMNNREKNRTERK
jgi:hypothetical protein